MKTAGRMTAMAAVLVGAMLALSGPAWSDEKRGGKEQDESAKAVELSATTTITIDQAIKTASEKVAGKVIEAELEEKNGKAIWEVEIVDGNKKVTEVHVDAGTGAVVATQEKKAKNR